MNRVAVARTVRRKASDSLRRLFAPLIAARSGLSGGPVLVNSMAKSGTHLALQLVAAAPGKAYLGTFLADYPSLTLQLRDEGSILAGMSSLRAGEIAAAHLFHSKEREALVAGQGIMHVFLYRDPRDVAVSEAHYLSEMNPFHRLHRYFARLETWDERLLLAILGSDYMDVPYYYPPIATRYRRYLGWLHAPGTLAISFEELRQPENVDAVIRLLAHCLNGPTSDALHQLAEKARHGVEPSSSHTFRKGAQGSWREEFGRAHVKAFERTAGDLLEQLGYTMGEGV